MNKVFLTTTTALLIATGSAAAFADCEIFNADLDKKISESQELRAEYSSALLRDARTLRDAAGTLAAYGKEDACESVSEAIAEMIENPKDAAAAKAGVTGEEVVIKTKSTDDRRASAVSISKMTSKIRAEEIIGTDVYGAKGDTVGEVADIVFGGQRPTDVRCRFLRWVSGRSRRPGGNSVQAAQGFLRQRSLFYRYDRGRA